MSREKDRNSSLSRYISLILRHHPEIAGITLDSHGWADVHELIEGINRTRKIDAETLANIVATDSKGRYSFSEDGTKIRANQGHSVKVDVELEEKEPPEILWHGTGERFTRSIEAEGLRPMTRLYVHLSGDYDTAMKTGRRHGKPIVYTVKAGLMHREGHKFFRSVNGVWLTKEVPPQYLERSEKKSE